MVADLLIPEAQGLQRAQLDALILHHARQRGYHDHRCNGVHQHREQIGQAAEHRHIVPGGNGGGVVVLVDDQRVRQRGADGSLHGVRVRALIHVDQQVVVGQLRHGAARYQHKAVVGGVGGHVLGGEDVLRRKDDAANREGLALAHDLQGQAVAHDQVVVLGELLLHQAAPQVGGNQPLALTDQGDVDGHLPVVGVHGHGHVAAHVWGVHLQAAAGQDGLHALDTLQPGQILLGEGRALHPEVGQVVFLIVGLGGFLQQPPVGVQAGENPRPQRAEQEHGQELHGAASHVPEELLGQGAAARLGGLFRRRFACYHVISSTRAG